MITNELLVGKPFKFPSGCANNKERAKYILRFLTMPVPRRWWENALESGNVDKNHASVLHGWQEELSSILDSDEDYLAKAEGVLEKRPESAVLGRQILNKCLD